MGPATVMPRVNQPPIHRIAKTTTKPQLSGTIKREFRDSPDPRELKEEQQDFDDFTLDCHG